MKRTVLKMTLNGEYRVTKDDEAIRDAYRVTYSWRDPRKHTKQIGRFDNLCACLQLLEGIAWKQNV